MNIDNEQNIGYIDSRKGNKEAVYMKHLRFHIDRWFLSFIGIFILSHVCLGLKDTNVSKIQVTEEKGICNVINPKGYFISKIAPLFANWSNNNNICTVNKINEIFKNLGIKAKLKEGTIKFCNGSFEFLIYIPAYKKDFVFKYTPLINDLSMLIRNERFLLEVKLFSSWQPIKIERLFG